MAKPASAPPAPKSKSGKQFRGKPRLTPDEREARQGMMLVQKLTGKYVPEIAAAFGVSTTVVYDELKEAQRKALHQKAVGFITLNLMPKALAVFAAALDQGDKEIAIRVLEGMGVLGTRGQPGLLQVNVGVGGDDGVESFEAWRLKVSRSLAGKALTAANESRPADRLDAERDVIDVEVTAEGGETGDGPGAGEGSVEGGGA